MPEKDSSQPQPKSMLDVVHEVGVYPIEAYDFVQQGLSFTVNKIHGERSVQENRHISGQQLSWGLRDFALERWGMLARTVLARWNITASLDFGKIVFALVEYGHMSKTDEDTLEDFRNVFDFRTAFETDYKIGKQK